MYGVVVVVHLNSGMIYDLMSAKCDSCACIGVSFAVLWSTVIDCVCSEYVV